MKLELTLEHLPEVTQPLPEHKTNQSGQSQDAHEDNLPGNTEHEKSANAEEHQDEKATTEDEKSEEVGNDDVADTTKEEELKWAELLLEDDYDFETATDKSPSQQEWSRQKCEENQQNVYLDLKAHFLAVKEKVDIAKRWTSKNMIAQIYTEFLHSIGVVDKKKFAVENKWHKDKITPEVSILFFWDADRGSNSRTVLMLSFRKLDPDTQKALDTSSESRRRFSNIIRLENYRESEIFELLTLQKQTGVYQKIAGRALAEGRAFTNAHAVAEGVDKVCERYQKRKEAAWMAWAKTHSPEDGETLGPEHFKDGISLEDEDIEHIIDLAEVNYQHQLHGLKPLPISHNCCFLGPPDVGKTTVAALYAKILTELGLLSKGHVIAKKASDLIGRYCGHSEGDTAEALQDTKGGVLIIDDAHLLYQERAYGSNDPDDFRQGVIDTLVANISGSPGEDRCVILCGYEDRMERMFLRSNPGLGRSFPLENAFRFTSYDDDELGQILKQKMESEDLVATDEAFKVAHDMLSRMRRRPNFGNGGDYQKMANGMRRYGLDPKPHIPWAFVFKGPPGTGKTSTARKVGKLFYDIGFLSSDEVVTCSVTNLTGELSGHTGPKVINQFELGLGKVLFIDEAYRLIGDSFHKEAIGELVDVMTKPRYAHNIVVILAGYSDEMEELLMLNPGLRSRFPTLLEKLLSKLNISLSISTTGEHKAAVLDVLKQLIDNSQQAIIELVFTKAGEAEEISGSEGLCVSYKELMDCLEAILKHRGGFTAACCGIPVDEGELNWTEPIRSYIPFTNTVDPVVGQRATSQDALSHNRGLAYMDLTWLGVECDSILDKKDLLEVISRLPPVNDLRIVFHYNNCMYAVAGLVIEQQSGRPWYEFLKERILEPLGMHRTVRHRKKLPHGNVAEPHVVIDGYSLHRQKPVDAAADDTFMELAGGVWSNVSDMMKWAKLSSTPCTSSLRSSNRFRPSYHTNPISPPLP
ncbi:hypothetical protein IWW34DRAFT_801302 [Fusarium oxysporum f. sp. albedinis]|nr:hypothetical protein IWW34DRAFT_801302 [Fusarium oxysporum f. sp. albedinis]